MDRDKFINVVENIEHKSNKELLETEDFLFKQHEELKKYIVELTFKLETIENIHGNVLNEIEKRKV